MACNQEATVTSTQDGTKDYSPCSPSVAEEKEDKPLARVKPRRKENEGHGEKSISEAQAEKPKGKNKPQKFPWIVKFNILCQRVVCSCSYTDLATLMSLYIKCVSTDVQFCYSKQKRAAKLLAKMNDHIKLFHMLYTELRKPLQDNDYLDKMSIILAMYIDMEIKVSLHVMETPSKVSGRIISALHILLDNSVTYIKETVLQAKLMVVRKYNDVCIPVIKHVAMLGFPEKNLITPVQLDGDMYVRYFSLFKLWKEVEKKPDVSEKVAKMLKPSPSLYNDYYYTKKYYNRLPQIHKKVGIGEFTFSLMEKKTRTNTLRPKSDLLSVLANVQDEYTDTELNLQLFLEDLLPVTTSENDKCSLVYYQTVWKEMKHINPSFDHKPDNPFDCVFEDYFNANLKKQQNAETNGELEFVEESENSMADFRRSGPNKALDSKCAITSHMQNNLKKGRKINLSNERYSRGGAKLMKADSRDEVIIETIDLTIDDVEIKEEPKELTCINIPPKLTNCRIKSKCNIKTECSKSYSDERVSSNEIGEEPGNQSTFNQNVLAVKPFGSIKPEVRQLTFDRSETLNSFPVKTINIPKLDKEIIQTTHSDVEKTNSSSLSNQFLFFRPYILERKDSEHCLITTNQLVTNNQPKQIEHFRIHNSESKREEKSVFNSEKKIVKLASKDMSEPSNHVDEHKELSIIKTQKWDSQTITYQETSRPVVKPGLPNQSPLAVVKPKKLTHGKGINVDLGSKHKKDEGPDYEDLRDSVVSLNWTENLEQDEETVPCSGIENSVSSTVMNVDKPYIIGEMLPLSKINFTESREFVSPKKDHGINIEKHLPCAEKDNVMPKPTLFSEITMKVSIKDGQPDQMKETKETLKTGIEPQNLNYNDYFPVLHSNIEKPLPYEKTTNEAFNSKVLEITKVPPHNNLKSPEKDCVMLEIELFSESSIIVPEEKKITNEILDSGTVTNLKYPDQNDAMLEPKLSLENTIKVSEEDSSVPMKGTNEYKKTGIETQDLNHNEFFSLLDFNIEKPLICNKKTSEALKRKEILKVSPDSGLNSPEQNIVMPEPVLSSESTIKVSEVHSVVTNLKNPDQNNVVQGPELSSEYTLKVSKEDGQPDQIKETNETLKSSFEPENLEYKNFLTLLSLNIQMPMCDKKTNEALLEMSKVLPDNNFKYPEQDNVMLELEFPSGEDWEPKLTNKTSVALQSGIQAVELKHRDPLSVLDLDDKLGYKIPGENEDLFELDSKNPGDNEGDWANECVIKRSKDGLYDFDINDLFRTVDGGPSALDCIISSVYYPDTNSSSDPQDKIRKRFNGEDPQEELCEQLNGEDVFLGHNNCSFPCNCALLEEDQDEGVPRLEELYENFTYDQPMNLEENNFTPHHQVSLVEQALSPEKDQRNPSEGSKEKVTSRNHMNNKQKLQMEDVDNVEEKESVENVEKIVENVEKTKKSINTKRAKAMLNVEYAPLDEPLHKFIARRWTWQFPRLRTCCNELVRRISRVPRVCASLYTVFYN